MSLGTVVCSTCVLHVLLAVSSSQTISLVLFAPLQHRMQNVLWDEESGVGKKRAAVPAFGLSSEPWQLLHRACSD